MADTGAVLPQSAATASEDPWLDNDWTSPANIYGAGEASVTAASYDAGDQTFVLKAYNFDFSAIPSGSTIDGVVCVITARYATAAVSIDLVQLLNTSLAKVGNNLAGPTALTTSSAPYTFGSSTNKWGNALDDVWVKNSNFGVAVGMLAGGSGNSNNDVYVDSVTLQIYYTVNAQQYTKTLTTTEAISDTRAKVATFDKLLTLSEAISDSITKVAGRIKSLTTTEGISDLVSNSIGFIKTILESVGITDNIARFSNYVKTISDSIGITDIFSKIAEFARNVLDSEPISDLFSKETVYNKLIETTEAISDSIFRIISFVKLITNTLGITDYQIIPRGSIINIDHETGDLSQYTSYVDDGGDLSVAVGAALAGTGYGLSCLIDDQTAIYGQKNAASSSGTIRVRVYIDPNSLTMADGNGFTFVELINSSSARIGRIQLGYTVAGGYQVYGSLYNDAGTEDFLSTSYAITDEPHYVELLITRSSGANDGTGQFWIDGVSKASEAGKDNDTRFADFAYVRLGASQGLDPGTSGTFFLDELIVNDTGDEIGPKAALLQKLIETTEAISDSLINAVERIVALFDSVGITDAISKVIDYSKAVAESVGITDTASKVINYIRTVSVTEAISDSMSAFSGLVKLIADSVGITDAVSKIYNSVRTIAITESISDNVSKSVSYIRTLTTQEGITDLVNKSVGYIKSIANSVGITDFIDAVTQSFNNYETTISDSEGISDSLSKQVVFLLTKTDTESISDIVAKSILFTKLISDSLGTTDALTKIGEFVITILTVESISDSISRTVQFIRDIADSVSMSEVITAIKNYVKPFVPHIHLGGTTSGHIDNVGKVDKNVRLAGHVDKNND